MDVGEEYDSDTSESASHSSTETPPPKKPIIPTHGLSPSPSPSNEDDEHGDEHGEKDKCENSHKSSHFGLPNPDHALRLLTQQF